MTGLGASEIDDIVVLGDALGVDGMTYTLPDSLYAGVVILSNIVTEPGHAEAVVCTTGAGPGNTGMDDDRDTVDAVCVTEYDASPNTAAAVAYASYAAVSASDDPRGLSGAVYRDNVDG